jgi:hypothetical protein
MIATFRARGYRKLVMEVPTLADGRDYIVTKIDSSGLGASDIGRCTIEDGEQTFRVSYNGRVWAPDGTEVQL